MNETDIKPFNERMADIAIRAGSVLGFARTPQFDDNKLFIQDPATRHSKIVSAACMDPIFEGVNPDAVGMIASGWASALAEYANKYNSMPRPEILAASHKSLENVIRSMTESVPGSKTTTQKMLESVSKDMGTSEGILRQAQFMAMILPAALGAATSDACTFIPCDRDEALVYEIYNVAASDFGDYQIGDRLNMQSAGAYSQLRRPYILKEDQQPDGSKTTFNFKINEHERKDMPIRTNRVNIFVDRVKSKNDDGDGNIMTSFTGTDGKEITITGKIDYKKGTISLTSAVALPVGVELAVEVEINIESSAELIPTINHAMRKYVLSPSAYVLAAEHTVQALHDGLREFGVDLGSMQYRALRDFLAHEIDMTRLRTMLWRNKWTDTFDISLPETQSFEQWAYLFKGKLHRVSNNIVNRNLASGMVGAFAGADAANFIKQLPASMFTPADNYRQTPHVQFAGTLFGVYKIFEIPQAVCDSFNQMGVKFDSESMLCYARGDGIAQAGFVTGDAVPAIPFVHPTNPALVNRTTLWGSAINDLHPRNGADYFCLLTLTSAKVGSIDYRTGKKITGDASPASFAISANLTSDATDEQKVDLVKDSETDTSSTKSSNDNSSENNNSGGQGDANTAVPTAKATKPQK